VEELLRRGGRGPPVDHDGAALARGEPAPLQETLEPLGTEPDEPGGLRARAAQAGEQRVEQQRDRLPVPAEYISQLRERAVALDDGVGDQLSALPRDQVIEADRRVVRTA